MLRISYRAIVKGVFARYCIWLCNTLALTMIIVTRKHHLNQYYYTEQYRLTSETFLLVIGIAYSLGN